MAQTIKSYNYLSEKQIKIIKKTHTQKKEQREKESNINWKMIININYFFLTGRNKNKSLIKNKIIKIKNKTKSIYAQIRIKNPC